MAGGAAQAYTVMGFCTCMKTVAVTRKSTPDCFEASTWSEFVNIWKNEGFRGINKGVNAVALRQMSNWGSRMGFSRLSEDGVTWLTGRSQNSRLNTTEKILCSAFGGALACWNHPIEVIRVEMQSMKADPNRPKDLTIAKAMRFIYSDSGMRGLYRGVLPRMCLGIWQTICIVALGDM